MQKHVLTNLKIQEYEQRNVFSQLDQSHQNRLVWTHPHKGGAWKYYSYLLQSLARPGIILQRTVASHFTYPPVFPCGVVVGLVPIGAVGKGQVVAEVTSGCGKCKQASKDYKLSSHSWNGKKRVKCMQAWGCQIGDVLLWPVQASRQRLSIEIAWWSQSEIVKTDPRLIWRWDTCVKMTIWPLPLYDHRGNYLAE